MDLAICWELSYWCWKITHSLALLQTYAHTACSYNSLPWVYRLYVPLHTALCLSVTVFEAFQTPLFRVEHNSFCPPRQMIVFSSHNIKSAQKDPDESIKTVAVNSKHEIILIYSYIKLNTIYFILSLMRSPGQCFLLINLQINFKK